MRSLAGLALLVAFSLFLGPACATQSGGDAPPPREPAAAKQPQAAPKAQQEAAKAQKGKKAEGVPAPAGSPLSKVQVGMNDTQVRQAIGEPTNTAGYITGKAFIPYYYGSDTSRVEYKYAGQGRVVFSRNAYSGGLKVVRIDYDPTETGN